MGWVDDIDIAICDSCGREKRYKSHEEAQDFLETKYRQLDGKEDSLLLCWECAPKYKTFKRMQDEQFLVFCKEMKIK